MRDSFYSFQFIKTLCFNWLERHTLSHTNKATSNTNKTEERKTHEAREKSAYTTKRETNSSFRVELKLVGNRNGCEKVTFQICQRFFASYVYVLCMHACVHVAARSSIHCLSDIQFMTAVSTLALHNTDITCINETIKHCYDQFFNKQLSIFIYLRCHIHIRLGFQCFFPVHPSRSHDTFCVGFICSSFFASLLYFDRIFFLLINMQYHSNFRTNAFLSLPFIDFYKTKQLSK